MIDPKKVSNVEMNVINKFLDYFGEESHKVLSFRHLHISEWDTDAFLVRCATIIDLMSTLQREAIEKRKKLR